MRATELAAWCLVTGFGPDIHAGLTRLEREAFLETAVRMRGR